MFLNLGRMPGAGISRPETYRLQFASAMGARPDADLRLEGGVTKVHEFLVSRLDMHPDRASQVTAALSGSGVAAAEVDISADELRTLTRTLRAEEKAAAQKQKTPVSATVSEPSLTV